MPPLVSICLTCKDRWELTRQALESALGNTNLKVNLAVCDDKSNPKNNTALGQWWFERFHGNDDYHDRLRWLQGLGVGGAKNHAVGIACNDESKYLCLLDNDVVCKPGWLETLIGAYEAGYPLGYRLIGGYAHPFNQTNRIHEAWHIGGEVSLHEKNAVDGLCHFMEWETWDKYGPLDSHAQGVRQSEDFAFCRKIVDAGFKVGVVYPHVIENHGVVDTFGERIPGAELVEAELRK